MNDERNKLILAWLNRMGAIFPTRRSEDDWVIATNLFQEALSGFHYNDIDAGFKAWSIEGKFYPVPADIVVFCQRREDHRSKMTTFDKPQLPAPEIESDPPEVRQRAIEEWKAARPGILAADPNVTVGLADLTPEAAKARLKANTDMSEEDFEKAFNALPDKPIGGRWKSVIV